MSFLILASTSCPPEKPQIQSPLPEGKLVEEDSIVEGSVSFQFAIFRVQKLTVFVNGHVQCLLFSSPGMHPGWL